MVKKQYFQLSRSWQMASLGERDRVHKSKHMHKKSSWQILHSLCFPLIYRWKRVWVWAVVVVRANSPFLVQGQPEASTQPSEGHLRGPREHPHQDHRGRTWVEVMQIIIIRDFPKTGLNSIFKSFEQVLPSFYWETQLSIVCLRSNCYIIAKQGLKLIRNFQGNWRPVKSKRKKTWQCSGNP